MRISLLLVGYGNVARRFVQLLDESRDSLDALGLEPVIAGIVTRHGGVFDNAGLIRNPMPGEGLQPQSESTAQWIESHVPRISDICVVVETTTLDVLSGEPALSHVRAALAAGAHVITANKGPAAFAAAELLAAAETRGLSFLFEGAVMDGIPVFNLVRDTCPAVTVRGFRGVINSTTNHIITALERDEPFDTALARMQRDGVAEADASLDLDGWDAAAKTAALANVWLDARTTPRQIRREGIDGSTGARAKAALANGRRLKLVAWATLAQGTAGKTDSAVELQELAPDDPLGILDGQGNALEIDTWPLGRIVITQRDGGLEKTAQALVSDLVTAARRARERR